MKDTNVQMVYEKIKTSSVIISVMVTGNMSESEVTILISTFERQNSLQQEQRSTQSHVVHQKLEQPVNISSLPSYSSSLAGQGTQTAQMQTDVTI